ncbi:MAG: DUF1501 domain-containing protein [Planctomycetaceae bacterium]
MTRRENLANRLTRRRWLATTAAAAAGGAGSGWLRSLASAAETAGRAKRSCVLLWMNGGPSQTDTFDMKPGHEHGGPFQPIETRAPGIQICEHLPEMARWTDHLAVVRSMSTREGDHGRARDNLRTGYFPQASIQFPVFGSLVSSEWGESDRDLPNYVSIFSRGLFGAGSPPAGFLGPTHAPVMVGGADESPNAAPRLTVENLSLPLRVSARQATERLELLHRLEREFLAGRPGEAAEGHRNAYARATRLMSPGAARTFDLDDEPADVHERYGRSQFGQGCLLARRLIERRVPFVEVSLGGWDTHEDNFTRVQDLCGALDKAWSALLQDLNDRRLLDSTLVVWMGEFGRTPVINPRQGRDHYPKAWSVVLGGGGIRGGQIVGRTSADAMAVEDRPVSTPDLLGTICLALGLDPDKQNVSNVGRPIRLVDPSARPISEIVVPA